MFEDIGRKERGQGGPDQNFRGGIVSAVGVEHSTESRIDVTHPQIAVEGEHAGGNVFENGFHLAAALIEFRIGSTQIPAGSFNLPTTALQVFSHAVEGADKVPDFVSGTDVHAVIQASARDFLSCFR